MTDNQFIIVKIVNKNKELTVYPAYPLSTLQLGNQNGRWGETSFYKVISANQWKQCDKIRIPPSYLSQMNL